MRYIVFANGYKTTESIRGAITSKPYLFRKGFVTKVENADAEAILNKTSKDIQWCMKISSIEKPFKTLKDYCKEKSCETRNYLKNYLLASS